MRNHSCFLHQQGQEPSVPSLLYQLKIHLLAPLAALPKRVIFLRTVVTLKLVILGKLELLDNQAAFAEVFGDKPKIISPNIITSKDITSTARSLYYFGEKCKLDLFLHVCRKYYVGHISVENSLIIKEVCHKIS